MMTNSLAGVAGRQQLRTRDFMIGINLRVRREREMLHGRKNKSFLRRGQREMRLAEEGVKLLTRVT